MSTMETKGRQGTLSQIADFAKGLVADIFALPSGDAALTVLPVGINPLHQSQINPSYVITRDGSGYVTKLEVEINGTTYSKDFTRDVSNRVTAITAWY